MEEKKITEEELTELIKECINQSYTVSEALNEKMIEDKQTEESFKICFAEHKIISLCRKRALLLLKTTKVHFYLTKLISLLLNRGAEDIIDSTIDKINATKEIYENEKDLLRFLKDSLKELYKNKVTVCNYDICVLLFFLHEYNTTLLLDLNDYMEMGTSAISGIRYISNKGYDEKIDNLKEKIDDHSLKLGYNNK